MSDRQAPKPHQVLVLKSKYLNASLSERGYEAKEI